ncbi:MAG: proteasome assembly chaperone family protein [Thermoplasmatales archaeon]
MDSVIIRLAEDVKLKNSVLLVGLPGIGNVGKISADFLIENLKAKKLADVFSTHLPPQVLINEEASARLVRNELYYKKRKEGDLIIFTGDFQGLTSQGQYEICYRVLELTQKFDVKKIVTLGGYQIGKLMEIPRVLGAYTSKDMKNEVEKLGVVFSKNEPGGGIVGGAGLILGLGFELFDLPGVCLMGETSGYFTDPKSAKQVTKVVVDYLRLNADVSIFDERIKEIDDITNKMMEAPPEEKREDLGYFG